MARTQLTVTEVVRAGVTQPSEQNSDVANGNYIDSADANAVWWMEARNTAGASRTVTVTVNPNITVDSLTVSNYSNTIAAGATETMGPFKYQSFRQPSDSNRVYVDASGSSGDVKFRVYKITPA